MSERQKIAIAKYCDDLAECVLRFGREETCLEIEMSDLVIGVRSGNSLRRIIADRTEYTPDDTVLRDGLFYGYLVSLKDNQSLYLFEAGPSFDYAVVRVVSFAAIVGAFAHEDGTPFAKKMEELNDVIEHLT